MKDVFWLILILSLTSLLAFVSCGETPTEPEFPREVEVEPSTIPVILDTDIGTDIDDTWALALLLALPELDTKLVVTDSGDTIARAKITARFLEVAGRTDIPIGIGKRIGDSFVPQIEWAEDYDLESYPGTVYTDGIGAMIDLIMNAERPVTVIAIGPVPNIKEALEREPTIAQKTRVFAMSGSVDVGYDGKSEPDAEYNVTHDIEAARAMYEAGWDLTIAPLDTAGLIRLEGDLYKRILDSEDPVLKALIENYRLWASRIDWTQVDPEETSSVLFDTLAIALIQWDQFCEVSTVPLIVDEEGFTRRNESGKPVKAALTWKDKPGFEAWLFEKLTESSSRE